MLSYMQDATENAPRFIAAFVDGCESQAENGKDVPDIDIVNEILAKHETGYQVVDGMVLAADEHVVEQASRKSLESPKRPPTSVAKPDTAPVWRRRCERQEAHAAKGFPLPYVGRQARG